MHDALKLQGFDHAVVNVRDGMDDAVRRWQQFGFSLTPRGFHSAGSINHLMMLGSDYIELLGFPPGGENARPELRDQPVGLNGLVLRSDDAQVLHDDLRARGVMVNPVDQLSRPIDTAQGPREVRFATVCFPVGAGVAGGRLYFCQHLTPELVWQPQWQSHANGATAVKFISVVVPDPKAEAAVYARIFGDSQVEDLGWGVRVRMGHAAALLCTLKDFQEHFPHGALDLGQRTACMAALTVKVDSLARVGELLALNGVALHPGPKSLYVPATLANNLVLEFTQ